MAGHEDHDDHDDDHDDHDDHDDGHHDGHDHAEAEKVLANPESCPADTNIQIFHMEEGEHVLEFESEHDEDFNMAALKMLGGHAHHHHHGHGSGPFEWAGIFSINDDTHTWTMEKVDGSYADPSMRVVLIPTDEPTEETMHSLESGVEALIEGDACTVIEDGESMTPVDGGSCFEWHVGSGDISTFTINTAGISGLAAYTAHSPYEFEATQHYLKDSAGNDVEHIAEEGGGGHGDHGDHGDDHDDHSDEEDDHGDHWSPETCHDEETHETHEEYTNEEDCEAAGHLWMAEEHELPEIHADRVAHTLSFPEDDHSDEEDDHDDHSDEEEHHEMGALVIHIEEEGDYGFALPNDIELFVIMGEGGHDDHDDHGHGSGPFEWAGIFSINDDTHTWTMEKVDGSYADPSMRVVLIPTDEPTEETMHSLESGVEALIEGDACTVIEDGESMTPVDGGSCFEWHVGSGDISTFTINTAGISGLAAYTAHSPYEFEATQHYLKDSAGNDVEHIAEEGGGGHGDHGDHGDDHDDHDDDGGEIVADDDEEAFDYDPHSWLDPISFNEQLNLVLEKMITVFPDGTDVFTANAETYSASLTQLSNNFEAAFGVDGSCVTGGHDKTIVANHNAYSYLSVRYDIDILTIHGLDPEGEPSPGEVAEVVEQINEKGITTLYIEEYTDPTAVQSIVEETGVSVKILYTMEMQPSDSNDDYLSMMDKNLNNMVAGIGC